MKKIILLLLCRGVLVSMVGCGGNTAPPPTESPPTTVSETIMTETPTETTPPVTAAEPTEKEKEPLPTVSKGQATEPTVTATEPTTTAKPTEETKRTETAKKLRSFALGWGRKALVFNALRPLSPSKLIYCIAKIYMVK